MHATAATPAVETDVVVIGGGGSGLAAAIEAASLGRRVVLLETHTHLGGTTGRSIGSVTATNTPHQLRKGILDSPDHHLQDLDLFNAAAGAPDNAALKPPAFATRSTPVSTSWDRCTRRAPRRA